MKLRKGERWKIDGRKGPLTVKLLQGVESTSDDFFKVEILDGTARYLSIENNLEQKAFWKGTPGHVISLRASFCKFIERVKR